MIQKTILAILILSVCGCSSQKEQAEFQCPMKCEGTQTYVQAGQCPICKMDLKAKSETKTLEKKKESEISGLSIFNLSSRWVTQNQDSLQWKDLNGHVLVVAMVYASCKAACPRLIADMQNIAKQVATESVRYVLVSIDPETDTPEKLHQLAKDNQLGEQWLLLNGSLADVRELSNILAVKYAKISPLDFSHSNIISVIDADGVLNYQLEGLNQNYQFLVEKVNALSSLAN